MTCWVGHHVDFGHGVPSQYGHHIGPLIHGVMMDHITICSSHDVLGGCTLTWPWRALSTVFTVAVNDHGVLLTVFLSTMARCLEHSPAVTMTCSAGGVGGEVAGDHGVLPVTS